MRKSGWAAAAGLGTMALLLTACGGSSGSSASGSTSTPTESSVATSSAGQPSGSALGNIQPGSVVLIPEKSAIGYVLAEANGQVVYTYAKDTKGGSPTCTGSCADTWKPVTGKPLASTASKGLGTLGTVSDTNGAKQVTYDGQPLYTYKGAKAFVTTGNGVDGQWAVIKLSKSNIIGG
jgi:predicted lipoprotein with Yx(FWY)xxD motif